MRIYFFATALLVFFFSGTSSYSQSFSFRLEWAQPVTEPVLQKKILYFEGASFGNKERLPVFTTDLPLMQGETANVSLSEEVYEPLGYDNIIGSSDLIKKDISVTSAITYEKKKPSLHVSLIPLRYGASGAVEKLVSFTINIVRYDGGTSLRSSAPPRTYAPRSVLASGKWFRVGVVKDSIYRLSYTFLKSLGMDVDNINPNNIRVYGNGGAMIPESNLLPRTDDLMENPVEIVGAADGKFNQEDYVLFFGQGPHKWKLDANGKRYHHVLNIYSDTSFYFITADTGPGKRVSTISSLSDSPTDNVSSFDDHAFYELEKELLIKSGRNWYGETFDIVLQRSFKQVFPHIDPATPVYFRSVVAARSVGSGSSFTVNFGTSAFAQAIGSVIDNPHTAFAAVSQMDSVFVPSGSEININYTYNKPSPSSIGWLDYFELNCRRMLTTASRQMFFRDKNSLGSGKIAQFAINNVTPGMVIWDITDPFNVRKQDYSITGSTGTFRARTDELRQYVIFSGGSFPEPFAKGAVPNQNLHGLPFLDMIIVAPPVLLPEVKRLAHFHETKDGLKSITITPQQIYNEFSSGSQDITAIRDFIKMFYDRAQGDSTKFPKYLLLFGDGSFDPKNRIANNNNFIPTYQSAESLSPIDSYTSDDYYALLDDTEGDWTLPYKLDIAVGRLPFNNVSEAKNIVDKILRYHSAWGDWRNVVCVVADDQDQSGIGFSTNSEDLIDVIRSQGHFNYNVDKIYSDAYKQESSGGGQHYPGVTSDLTNRVEKGALIINYIGHGGEAGWAHERILTTEDILSWRNKNMPLFMTATCEFSRFDDPERTSAGEMVLMNPHGGGIALLTTVRVTFASSNQRLNIAFFRRAFKTVNGKYPAIGEIFRQVKSDVSFEYNTRNFMLLGDPAITLNYPNPAYKINTTRVNNIPVDATMDTLKGLSKVSVTGNISDLNGNVLSDFNGVLYPTIFDKEVEHLTLNNDGEGLRHRFKLQKNALYKGKASVKNGWFSFSFIVPKDIGFKFGKGKFSYYVENNAFDAAGYYDKVMIGGTNGDTINDNIGPDIRLYMNDSKFVFGGITDPNPRLYGVLTDSSGINTVGNGIGHDIVATLDDAQENLYVLNDYYEADLDSYQKGKVSFAFKDLEEGRHNLKLKAWDVNNNSSESYTEFVVASSAKLALDHILNYPNPFTTRTSFYFEHNKPGMPLEVQIQIYSVSGKLVKTINTLVISDGYRSDPIDWDGRDDFGDTIGRGVYIYRLKVKSNNEIVGEKYEKLVILK